MGMSYDAVDVLRPVLIVATSYDSCQLPVTCLVVATPYDSYQAEHDEAACLAVIASKCQGLVVVQL